MEAHTTDLTLLEQHIFAQNRRLIESSASLNAFVQAVPVAIEQTEAIVRSLRDALPAEAEREMKRAGKEVLTALAGEIGQIAQRVASDAAAAERSRAFYWAGGLLAVFAMVFFGAGMALGTHAVGPFVIAAISLIIGIAAGMLLSQAIIASEPNRAIFENQSVMTPATGNRNWTEDELQRVNASRIAKLDDRRLEACRDVLVHGIDIFTATKTRKLGVTIVKNDVEKLRERMSLAKK